MKALLVISICAVLLLPAEACFSKEGKFVPVYAAVLENKVQIRAGQGLNFEVLGQLNKGDQVVVTGEKYGWYKVKLPKEAACFVHQDYIDRGRVGANKLYVRAGAGANFNVLGILKRGEMVDIRQVQGEWLKIAPPDNCAGWIKRDYLRLSKKEFLPPVFKAAPPQNKIKASGIIDDLGKIVNRQGTHKLIAGEKILYYLKSEGINLNHYIYQNVCVTGELVNAQASPYPVINVEQIKVRQ